MGNWIREGRDRLGITQEVLAERIGVNRTTLARMENGWKVSDALMEKLREAFSEDGRVWVDGSWIRAGRMALGLTQTDLAEKVGSSQTKISAAERGLGCSKPLEMKLRAVFGAAHKANWIREGRERLGITQENLADIVGVDRSVISRKEAGEIPSPELGEKIREALDERLPIPEDHKDGLKSRLESVAGKYGRACRDIKEKDKRIQALEAAIAEKDKKILELEDANETLDLTWRDVQQDNETLMAERDELKKAQLISAVLKAENEQLKQYAKQDIARIVYLSRATPIDQFRSVQAYEEAGRSSYHAAIIEELRRANAELFDRVAKLQAENAILRYKAGADL